MNKNLIILTLFSYIINILSQLQIVDPPQLREAFNNQHIEYSLANFGHVPYGRQIIGTAIKAEPIQACQPLNANFSQNTDSNPIIIVKRGNCSFVTKVKYAQLIGAKAVIIVDNKQERTKEITMADDGHAYEIRIPSFFIEETDGNKILNQLESQNVEQNHVVLTFKFEMQKQNHVNYSFWITTANRQSFALIREFEDYKNQLVNIANFTPHYAIWTCWYCKVQNYSNSPENCISGGRYCAPDPDGDGPATGREVILEDLRQICIFKQNKEKWWSYMKKFDKLCLNYVALNDCSIQIQNKLELDPKITEQCMQDSFVKKQYETTVDVLKNDNRILEQERIQFLQYGIIFWPSVTINKVQYRGTLESKNIMEAVCSAYSTTPEECKKYVLQDNIAPIQSPSVNVSAIVIVVVLLLVVVSLFMLFIYKRMVQRELKREMSSQVNSMVSQYIAFYETREKKSRDSEL